MKSITWVKWIAAKENRIHFSRFEKVLLGMSLNVIYRNLRVYSTVVDLPPLIGGLISSLKAR